MAQVKPFLRRECNDLASHSEQGNLAVDETLCIVFPEWNREHVPISCAQAGQVL